jgi:hypothetical protein
MKKSTKKARPSSKVKDLDPKAPVKGGAGSFPTDLL